MLVTMLLTSRALADHKKRREAELELHSALPAAALAFTSVTCSIDIKAKGGGAASTKTILEHVSGSAQPGRLLAVRLTRLSDAASAPLWPHKPDQVHSSCGVPPSWLVRLLLRMPRLGRA